MKTRKPKPADTVIPIHTKVPRSLHLRYKAACASRGVSMTDDPIAHMLSTFRGGPRRPARGRRA